MHNQLCNEILINKGDHCSHQCQFPHWGLAHEDYFCAQTFGIFEYSRILYFCSIRNTNTLSCVHLKYEYIFMRHLDKPYSHVYKPYIYEYNAYMGVSSRL